MNSRTYLYTVLFICRLTEYAKILFSEVAPLMWYIIHLYILMHYVGIYFLNISSSTAFLHIYLCKMIQVSFVYFSVLFILPQSCLLFLLFMSVYVSQRSCSGNLFLTAHRSLFKRGSVQFSSVQSLSRVWLFATPWIAARQASLSITNSRSWLKLMSIESVMPSAISSSVFPFSSCLQSLSASGTFPMSQLFAWGGQSIGIVSIKIKNAHAPLYIIFIPNNYFYKYTCSWGQQNVDKDIHHSSMVLTSKSLGTTKMSNINRLFKKLWNKSAMDILTEWGDFVLCCVLYHTTYWYNLCSKPV